MSTDYSKPKHPRVKNAVLTVSAIVVVFVVILAFSAPQPIYPQEPQMTTTPAPTIQPLKIGDHFNGSPTWINVELSKTLTFTLAPGGYSGSFQAYNFIDQNQIIEDNGLNDTYFYAVCIGYHIVQYGGDMYTTVKVTSLPASTFWLFKDDVIQHVDGIYTEQTVPVGSTFGSSWQVANPTDHSIDFEFKLWMSQHLLVIPVYKVVS